MPPASPTLDLVVSVADGIASAPDEAQFAVWVRACVEGPAALGIRVAGRRESARLNAQYRRKDGPTNVLSFPADAQVGAVPLLGDLVICAPVVDAEARERGMPPEQHWAHLVVHGVLHLRGFDHVDPADATDMERRESQLLAGLGYPDPYA